MTTQRTLMTAEELARLPDTGQRYELVRGELITMAPAGVVHGRTTTRIDRRLDTFVEGESLGVVVAGDVGFFLSHHPDTVRAPDVAFISKERVPAGGLPQGFFEGPPDLAIEVVSPGDSAADIQVKVQEWLGAGAKQVWVFYPRTRSVVIHSASGQATTLRETDTLTGGDLLPGFSCPVRELFP